MRALSSAKTRQIEKPWGEEIELQLDEGTLLKLIRIDDDARTSLQYHAVKEEVIHVIDGPGGVVDKHGRFIATLGESVHITPSMEHRSVGSVLLLEVSTNFPNDVVRVADDYNRA